jgi:hypothetical protein
LVGQVAEMIRHVIDNHNEPIPAVLEIPSKDHPYDASKDSILRRAKVHHFNSLLYGSPILSHGSSFFHCFTFTGNV